MGTIDDVMALKRQGFSDQDIVNELSQQGVSPREINDALKHAQIKNAVADNDYNQGESMEPSIMQGEEMMAAPAPQDMGAEYVPQEEQQYYQAGGEGGGYEQYAPAPAAVDTDTIIEISDQIFADRIKKFQKVLEATSEAAILLQSKFENLSERLKKIEMTIDKLQIAILEKVGSYGQNLESIKKEMSMMGDSFSKMVSPRESRRQIETSEEEEMPVQKRAISRKK
ncbi:MAG: hypothetical protein M1416_00495 [Candidatus Pacearchaeota archaeon]|nr:hypothetical protein [Candidatus Pacearchaeota archaeon]